VLVTVSDKKLAVDDGTYQEACTGGPNPFCELIKTSNTPDGIVDYYKADVITAGDYAPFGMALVGRKFSAGSGGYRYGFNGKENSDEIYSGAVSFEARIYDSRIGRFFSTDPRESEYAWQSTYVYFSNRPTSVVDNMGMGGTDPAPAGYYYDKVTKITTWLEENSKISSDQTYLGTEYYVTHRIDGIAGNSVTYRYKNNVESPETVNTQSESSEMMAINNNKETIATTRSNFSISFDNNTNNGSSETWVDGRGGFHKFAVSGIGGAAYDAGRGLWNSLTTWDGFSNLCIKANPFGMTYSLIESAQNFSLPKTTTQWGNATGQGMMLALPFMKGGGAAAVTKGGFGAMMEVEEAARYAKYWESYAPKLSTPGSRIDWTRVSGRTGRMEISRVIYDNGGRQIYRVDFSNHMRPSSHSNPHLHQYKYGPPFDPIIGKESLFNF
jgi:RHS repeat-associated protein